jgi:hypothetical protein
VQAAAKSALPQSLSGVAPEDAAALQEISSRLGTVKDLGGLNDLRQWLNNEAAAGYKQDGIAAARGTATKAGFRSAADAARNAYYDQLQKASGIDFQPIKAQQSALLNQQEGAAKLGQTLSSQQGLADEPKSKQQVLAEALTGGRAIKAGPIAGIGQLAAEKILNRTPLTQPNYLIREALKNLPNATPPASVATPSVAPNIAGQLPANATPPTIQGTPVPPSPPPSALPVSQQIALPQPAQPGLPQPSPQAALPNSRATLQLPQTTDGPNPTAPSPSPILNAATARMRIDPTQFQSPQVIPPTGARPVTPTGEVLSPIQRFLQSGELDNSILNPSTDDLKRAISNMRKRRDK